MEVIGLNGRTYKWTYSDKNRNKRESCSKYHKLCREIIKEVYGSYPVLEEVKLPGSSKNKSCLFLDFYIPSLKIAIEVHGEQHYNYVPFFHKTYAQFLYSQKRDNDKAEWCEKNGITLISLKYSDTEDEWREQLIKCE